MKVIRDILFEIWKVTPRSPRWQKLNDWMLNVALELK